MPSLPSDVWESLPHGLLPFEHLLPLIDTFALEGYLLHEKAVDLLKLHCVLISKIAELNVEPLDVRLKSSLVFVDRFSEASENIELILVDKVH